MVAEGVRVLPAGDLVREVARRYAPARLLVGLGAPGLGRSRPQVALQPLELALSPAPSVAAAPSEQVEPLAPAQAAMMDGAEPASPDPAPAWPERPWPFTVEQVRAALERPAAPHPAGGTRDEGGPVPKGPSAELQPLPRQVEPMRTTPDRSAAESAAAPSRRAQAQELATKAGAAERPAAAAPLPRSAPRGPAETTEPLTRPVAPPSPPPAPGIRRTPGEPQPAPSREEMTTAALEPEAPSEPTRASVELGAVPSTTIDAPSDAEETAQAATVVQSVGPASPPTLAVETPRPMPTTAPAPSVGEPAPDRAPAPTLSTPAPPAPLASSGTAISPAPDIARQPTADLELSARPASHIVEAPPLVQREAQVLPTSVLGTPAAPTTLRGAPGLGVRYETALESHRAARVLQPQAAEQTPVAAPGARAAAPVALTPSRPATVPARATAPPNRSATATGPEPTFSATEPANGVAAEAEGTALPSTGPVPQPAPLEQALFGRAILQRSAAPPTATQSRVAAAPKAPMVNVTYVQRQAEPAATTGQGVSASAPAEAPQAPEVDIERLAEQVFQRLRRRLQIEADRLGWPGWR